MSREQVADTINLLREHLKPIEGTDLYIYDEGWSDRRVFDEAGLVESDGFSLTHVSRSRLDMTPPRKVLAKPSAAGGDGGAALDLIAELTERVIKAERNIKRLAIEAGIDLKDAT
jgi:hypothetical protein